MDTLCVGVLLPQLCHLRHPDVRHGSLSAAQRPLRSPHHSLEQLRADRVVRVQHFKVRWRSVWPVLTIGPLPAALRDLACIFSCGGGVLV